MKKWNLIIDVAKCHDCNNCFLACKDEYYDNDFPPYSVAQPRHGHRWMNIMRKERGGYPKVDVAFLPIPCMHCDDAHCMAKTKGDAIYKREDGIVLIDPEKAKGQKDIVDTCPYGAIWWNDEKAVPQKCTFCVHLLEEGWEQPRCVQACPTDAMRFIHCEDSEREKIIASEKLEIYQPQHKSKPHVFFQNLYRYTQCFIAGSVALQDTDECAEGAKVSVSKGNEKAFDEVLTNNYGDFKVDKLEESSGEYQLEVEYPGYETAKLSVDLKTSVNLGTIFL